MLSRMKTLLSLAVVGFVFSVNFAGAFNEDDLEKKYTELKEIADDFADDLKLQNQKSQYGMDMGSEETNAELNDDENDESDEDELDDDESDKSDEEHLQDDENDGNETDVEDDGSEVVKSSDPRFNPRLLKYKIRRNGYGIIPKYGIIRFLRRLRRKNHYYRVKQRKIRKARRKGKLAKKIRLLQRKIRRAGRSKVPQGAHIWFF